jgi:hypothetical protein
VSGHGNWRNVLGHGLRDGLAQLGIWERPLAGAMYLALVDGAILLLSGVVVTHWVNVRGETWRQARDIRAVIDLGLILLFSGLALAAWRRLRGQSPTGGEGWLVWGGATALWFLMLVAYVQLIAVTDPDWKRAASLCWPLSRLLKNTLTVTLRGANGLTWSLLQGSAWGGYAAATDRSAPHAAGAFGAALSIRWGF